jgi:hypothetical protein
MYLNWSNRLDQVPLFSSSKVYAAAAAAVPNASWLCWLPWLIMEQSSKKHENMHRDREIDPQTAPCIYLERANQSKSAAAHLKLFQSGQNRIPPVQTIPVRQN